MMYDWPWKRGQALQTPTAPCLPYCPRACSSSMSGYPATTMASRYGTKNAPTQSTYITHEYSSQEGITHWASTCYRPQRQHVHCRGRVSPRAGLTIR